MAVRAITRFSVLLALAVCEGVTAADEVRAETGIMVPMRDGVRLSTDLYFPEEAAGKLPAVLWRSIYDKTGAYGREPALRELVQQGYVAVIQDTRGRGSSEGEFTPSVGDRSDGYDTVDWLTSQPWSNGKVGSAGCSSLGESQLLLAAARHPHHVAAIPQASASGFFIRGRPGLHSMAAYSNWHKRQAGSASMVTVSISVFCRS